VKYCTLERTVYHVVLDIHARIRVSKRVDGALVVIRVCEGIVCPVLGIGRLTGLAGVYLGPMIDTADEHAIVSLAAVYPYAH
jgi:hypothetical protein